MAVLFTNLSWWAWSGKAPSSLGSSETLTRFSSAKMPTNPRRTKPKWHSREEKRIDREYDLVLIPSDGGCCLSGSESDDSDWSIGWMEPLAPDFHTNNNEIDASFAVLVPCYGRGHKDLVDGSASGNHLSTAAVGLTNGYSAGKFLPTSPPNELDLAASQIRTSVIINEKL